MANFSKKRALPRAVAVVTVVSIAALATRLPSICAFSPIDRRESFSSITRPRDPNLSTKLLAANDEGEADKPTIETITDDNSSTLLHPASDPKRPVLVDAFAPWCGPCKLLDKVLRKAQPRYVDKVDFCRWNVNDKESTVELKKAFLDSGYTITKLPSLIVYREGKPVAVRPGFANEFQLDDFLEKTLPDVLERTFDEHGVKMLPLPEEMMVKKEEEDKKQAALEEESKKKAEAEAKKEEAVPETVAKVPLQDEGEAEELIECNDPEECFELLEKTIWQNRTVVPAMDGVLLPARRSKVTP